MRTRTVTLVGALLLAAASAAAGQEPGRQTQPVVGAPAPGDATETIMVPSTGEPMGRVDFGFRGATISGDAARFNRFRDVRDGAFMDRFRLQKETGSWFFVGEADRVGYRDQRFFAEVQAVGRVRGRLEWDQVPLFISGDTRGLQRHVGNGVLDIDDAIQRGIQAGTMTLADAVRGAAAFDLRNRRHTGTADLTYTASRDLDLTLKVRSSERKGSDMQAYGVLSSPSNGVVQELAVPLEHRTTDVKAMAEFANARGMWSAGVNASWFDNRIPIVQFDNPLRLTDIAAGPSRGLVATWPSNALVSFVANGAYKLPARTRALAAISIGRASQNERLPEATINTALVAPPLERTTAEASANIVSMVYGVNSRPVQNLWLNARYRFYDYANKTPHFAATQLVGDWSLGTAHWETEPISTRRNTLDLDASFTPLKYIAFGAGYGREDTHRTFRIYEKTAEDTMRVSVDSTGNQYVTLRVKYELSNRKGSGFDGHLLEEVSEQPGTRHFDIADRERQRVTSQVTLSPTGWFSVNASVSRGRDEYKNVGFGLRDNDNDGYTAGFDLMPLDTVSLGLSYGRETYTANQYSRTANPAPSPQFDDPTRDWWLDSDDRVDTITASVDLLKSIPKTDIRLAYDLSDGRATYVYGLRPDQTVFVPPARLQQLAPLTNRLTGARADVQYFIARNVAVGVAYWFEDYNVEDFSQTSATINSLNIGNTIYSGYLYRPYTAHSGWLRLTYLW